MNDTAKLEPTGMLLIPRARVLGRARDVARPDLAALALLDGEAVLVGLVPTRGVTSTPRRRGEASFRAGDEYQNQKSSCVVSDSVKFRTRFPS